MEVLNFIEFKVTDEMLASKSKRFANLIVDRILFYFLLLLLGFILALIAMLLGSDKILQFLESLDTVNPLLDALITSVFYVIFYFIFESTTQRTLGKLITQTKVVLENGEKPSMETIIVRSLSRIIPFDAFSFLGEIPKGWHDTMSKTFVVDVKIFDEHKKSHESFQLIGHQE